MAKKKKTEEKITENIKTIDYESEMQQSYIDYAMSVIMGRALPDIRDGHKPVQRRILYSMDGLNLDPNKPYKKSARIVGDTLGKFHPHGDSSVYEAMARMAQDFSLKIPLVDGHGNFGSIDGDEPASMRYCLTGDTYVNTDKGLVKIKDLVSNASEVLEDTIDINIMSFKRKKNHASKFFNSGIHPIKEIVTEGGYSIKGSYNHPIVVLSKDINNKPIFKWKKLEEITKDDYIVINRFCNIESKSDKITEKEAMFIGAMISEGFVSNPEKYYRIGFNNNNFEFVNDMKNLFEHVFGEDLLIGETESNTKNGINKEITIHNKELYKEFVEKYNFGITSEKRVVPNLVLESSLKIQSTFLRYLFEGDGSIYSIENGGAISYSSISFELIKQIQIMLLQYGIISNIHSDKKGYRLIITNKKNLKLFQANINFAYEEKRSKLSETLEIMESSNGFTNIGREKIPFISEYIRSSNKHKFVKKHNFSNKDKFSSYKNKLKEYLNENDFELLNYLHELNYYYVKVSSINDLEPQEVYCIKVDSDCHSFVANGFINHNTEARLSPIAMEMLDDLEKNVVDFKPNFDESLKEPTVLPSKFPNLLVNGANGIAVGMATNIPTHNLKEVIDAVIAYIDDESITVKDLLKYVKGPDFSTGGIITNKKDLKNIYETGRGKITIRSKIDVENAENGRHNIVITEIPYTYSGNKERLIDSIIDKANKKQLDEITDIRDESSDSIRIVIETKRGTDIEKFKHKLFKRTPLEDNYNVTFLALIDKQPVLFNLKTYVEEFVKFQREIYTRKYEYLLGKAETREEVLAGLIKAYDKIDLIIETIRGSKSTKDVKNCLVNGDTTNIKFKTKKSENLAKKFKYTEAQANAILDMKLQKLIALEKDLLEKEYKELLTTIKNYKKILTDSKTLNNVIKATLLEISKKYGTARKTQVKNLDTIDVEDEFVEEDLYILLDKFGYIKTIDENSYNRTENFDSYKLVLKSKNTDKLFFFTKNGMLHQINVLDIPKTKLREKGETIYNIFDLKDDEVIKIMIYPPDTKHLLFVTEQGMTKIVEVSELETNRKTIIGTKLKNDDKLLSVFEVKDEQNIALITKNSYLLKFKIDEISIMKRNTLGVSSMKLEDGDKIIDAKIFADTSDLELKYKDGKETETVMLRSVRSQKRNRKGSQLTKNKFELLE